MNEFITLPEAARRADVSTTSVRRWIASGTLSARKNKENQWEIEANILHTFLATQQPNRSGVRMATGRQGASATTQVGGNSSTTVVASDNYAEALKEAREALARERKINDEMRARIYELEQERTKHLAEMRGLLADDKEKDGKLSRWIRSRL